jgi:hypothetical protein
MIPIGDAFGPAAGRTGVETSDAEGGAAGFSAILELWLE